MTSRRSCAGCSTYTTPELRERVFAILEEVIPEGVDGKADPDTARPGMEQWKILVLGALRLGLNSDHDRLQELANQHHTTRQMLGHSDWADETYCEQQTLKDKLRLFTPQILDRINQEVVRAGHRALKKAMSALSVGVQPIVFGTHVAYVLSMSLVSPSKGAKSNFLTRVNQ
jgi:IS5 family transposase